MVSRDPIDMLLSGRMDRRAFTNTLGALGIGFATTTLGSRRVLAADEEASYFTWAGYELPEFHQAYIDKYGASPTTPGTSRATASLTPAAGNSPPLSTSSPIDSSSVATCSRTRSSTPS